METTSRRRVRTSWKDAWYGPRVNGRWNDRGLIQNSTHHTLHHQANETCVMLFRVRVFPGIPCRCGAATVADRRQTDRPEVQRVVSQYPPLPSVLSSSPQIKRYQHVLCTGTLLTRTGGTATARHRNGKTGSCARNRSASVVVVDDSVAVAVERENEKRTQGSGGAAVSVKILVRFDVGNQKNQQVPTRRIDPRGRGKRKTLEQKRSLASVTGSSFKFGKHRLVNHRNAYKDCRLVSGSKTPAGRVLSLAEDTSRLSSSGVSAKRSSCRPSMLLKCIDLLDRDGKQQKKRHVRGQSGLGGMYDRFRVVKVPALVSLELDGQEEVPKAKGHHKETRKCIVL